MTGEQTSIRDYDCKNRSSVSIIHVSVYIIRDSVFKISPHKDDFFSVPLLTFEQRYCIFTIDWKDTRIK